MGISGAMETDKTENELEFKPLTDGLGFHPFSNGMPYAPVRPKASPTSPASATGSGAIAGGKPVFHYAPQFHPRTITAPPLAPLAPLPSHVLPSTPLAPLEIPKSQGLLTYRLLGFITDTGINFILGLLALTLLFWKESNGVFSSLSSISSVSESVIIVGLLFLSLLNWSLITAQEVVFRTSLGKRLFNLILKDSGTSSELPPSPLRILLRSVLCVFSMTLAGLGILWAAFDSKGRTWHDLATGIEVARV